MGQFAGFSIDFADAGASHADLEILKSGILSSFLVVFQRGPSFKLRRVRRIPKWFFYHELPLSLQGVTGN